MKSVTANFRKAMLDPQTGETLLAFLTITHPSIMTLRYVNNTVAVTRGGNSYSPMGSDARMPSEQAGQYASAELVIDNVDLATGLALRTAAQTSFVLVDVTYALASNPDVDYLPTGTYKWRNISYDDHIVSGELMFDDDLDVVLPGEDYSPVNVPGVF